MNPPKKTKTNLKNWLQRPYYLNDSIGFYLSMSFGISAFATLFIILAKPLNIENLTSDLNVYAVHMGVISLLNLLNYFFIIKPAFPNYFDSENWTTGKHYFIVFLLLFVFLIATWIFNQYISNDPEVHKVSFTGVAKLVYGIGFIPAFLFLFADEKYGNFKRKKISEEIMQKKKSKLFDKNKPSNIEIYASNKKDKVSFDINNLVYVTFETNYSSFFILDEKKGIIEKILRIPLHAIEEVLTDYKNIVRCHKSYIINADYVNEISGNARGYYLHFNVLEMSIPASRKFTKKQLTVLFN